jgi:hypothetical protein
LAGRQAQTQGHVGFAGAAVAQGDHIVSARDVFTTGQLRHPDFVERRDGGKVEAVQAFDGGKAGGPDAPLDQAPFPVDQFLFAQAQQIGREIRAFLGTLFGQSIVFAQEGGVATAP